MKVQSGASKIVLVFTEPPLPPKKRKRMHNLNPKP